MCLLAFSYKQHPNYPFILVANRDEFFQRPTTALAAWQDSPHIVGGRDSLAGGSWLAASSTGKLAAVTNHRDGTRAVDPNARSRGHLISNFLNGDASAFEYYQQLQPIANQFSGFNLILLDQSGLFYLSNRSDNNQQLKQGLYGLSNAFLDSPWPKTVALKQRLQTQLDQQQLNSSLLLPLLRDSQTAHDDELPETGISKTREKQLSSCFINTGDYGTRASTAVYLDTEGKLTIAEQSFDSEGKTEFNQQIIEFGTLS